MKPRSSSELKRDARALLAGRWKVPAGACILELLFNFLTQNLLLAAFPLKAAGSSSILSLVFQLIIQFFSIVLSAGSMYLFLNLCRGRELRLMDVFYGFFHQPEHVLGWFLVTAAILFGLVSFPLTFVLDALLAQNAQMAVLSSGIFLICCAAGILISLHFVMFPFLYVEAPWKTSKELLLESRRMMKGQKLRYFYLQLTFLGLAALSMLTLGIGLIWLQPYMSAVNALFYLDLKNLQRADEPQSSARDTETAEP